MATKGTARIDSTVPLLGAPPGSPKKEPWVNTLADPRFFYDLNPFLPLLMP